jgi:hypothetical protein
MLTKINFEAMTKFGKCVLSAQMALIVFAGNATPAEDKNAGKAVTMIGRVLIRNEDEPNSSVRELKVGDPIRAGDVVNTRSDSTVKLIMIDKSIIDLGSSTLFKVDEWVTKSISDRSVALSLGYGKIRASVTTPVGPKGRFAIKTKAATMGVRGTEFLVTSDIGDKSGAGNAITTQVTVVHGKVDVTDKGTGGKPYEITTGKQLTTNAILVGDSIQRSTANSKPPKVIDISPQDMKTLVASIKVQDQTFMQAVYIDTGNKNQPSLGTSTLTAILGNSPVFTGSGPKPGDFGLPGTFVPGVNQVPTNILPPGVPVTLVVNFTRPASTPATAK